MTADGSNGMSFMWFEQIPNLFPVPPSPSMRENPPPQTFFPPQLQSNRFPLPLKVRTPTDDLHYFPHPVNYKPSIKASK